MFGVRLSSGGGGGGGVKLLRSCEEEIGLGTVAEGLWSSSRQVWALWLKGCGLSLDRSGHCGFRGVVFL